MNWLRHKLFVFTEDKLRIEHILYAFWGIFWLLNGLDKVLNWAGLKGPSGAYIIGWQGVNREEKFIEYFSRLHLPPGVARSTLYSICFLETLIGITFRAISISMQQFRSPNVTQRDAEQRVNKVLYCKIYADLTSYQYRSSQ